MAYTTSPKTRLIAIANPNNPTGAVASAEDLLLIARSAPQAAVLVDEAYFEFYGESLLEYAGPGAKPFHCANIFQGLWDGESASGSAGGRGGADTEPAAGLLSLQRERQSRWPACRPRWPIRNMFAGMWTK